MPFFSVYVLRASYHLIHVLKSDNWDANIIKNKTVILYADNAYA